MFSCVGCNRNFKHNRGLNVHLNKCDTYRTRLQDVHERLQRKRARTPDDNDAIRPNKKAQNTKETQNEALNKAPEVELQMLANTVRIFQYLRCEGMLM